MSSRDRALSIIELLARNADGLHLSDIAERLGLPRSGTHRLLNDLRENGYVRQEHERGIYTLTVKLASLSLVHQVGTGMVDLVLPILDSIAEQTGELAMLSVIEGERLMRVAKARGARRGLLYNPEEEPEVYLAATSNGYAYLSCLDDEKAIELIAKQGPLRGGYGSNAPRSIKEVMTYVHEARERGYSIIHDVFEAGTSAIAAPIRLPKSEHVVGTISVAGPSVRMTRDRLEVMAPLIISAADDVGRAATRSGMFEGHRYSTTGGSAPLPASSRWASMIG
ncbi:MULTISPECIES: IclR family transcriptional regulator [unclassified Mesorhizobium]|uniref:IclR family transcriptional regulator n=1 Tax=unclassified Mesorhizobium TaxID=325217 RepID=UPI00301478AB